MQTNVYQPRLPDEASLRAFSDGTIGMGQMEERGFSIYEVREGMLRLKLPIPGHDLSTATVPPVLIDMIRAHQQQKKG